MNDECKIRSLTPAVAGWWAKFTDDDGTVWYSPVAAWALCDVEYSKQRDTSEHVLPVLTCESGMAPHHQDEGYCELLYLPDRKFVFTDEPYCFAWYMVDDEGVAK